MSWFDGARIAVTGAAGGIGGATCARLTAQGARVFALDLAETGAGEFVHCDVTDEGSVDRAVGEVADSGGLDGLVAAAGTVENVPAEQMSAATFDRILGVNLRGVFLSCTAAARRMLPAGAGRIVAVSSMSGTHIVNHPQQQCAYNSSKAAVSALVRSLAVEWSPRGVRVNAVAPGYVSTPLTAGKPELHGGWIEDTVLRRFATPDEIAGSIRWLLDDEASYCTGTELLVDGGFSLR